MIDKITNKNNCHDKLLQIFRSLGDEIIFGTGEIVSSSNFIADKVYLIKSGTARLITKINGTSVLNTKNFKSIVGSLKTNSTANILVYRDTAPIFLAIKILKD